MINFLLKRTGYSILALICIASAAFMFYASSKESAIVDELAHIPAGYDYVHFLDYRLNPEHPPLLKALSAIPLSVLNPKFPIDNPAWTTEVNSQWAVGGAFLYGLGNNSQFLVNLARVGPILLTILLIVLIYIWSSKLIGYLWGLIPAFLFGLSPNVLAHGHYVTTDVAAAFGVVLSTYFFLRYLYSPGTKNLFLAGIGLGIALLCKFSTVLLIPIFALLIFIYYILSVSRDWMNTEKGKRFRKFFGRGLRYVGRLILIYLIAFILIVYPVYFLFTSHYPPQRQAYETSYLLGSFAGGPTPAGELCKPVRCLADVDIWMAKNPVTRPLAEYFLGVVMVVQRSSGGNTDYFLGQVSAQGSHWYFPVVYLLKEPLPVIIMILGALIFALYGIARLIFRRHWKSRFNFVDYLENNFTEFSMLLFVLVYWDSSINSPLNIGFRHLFPTLPFIYILAASAWKRWITLVEIHPGETLTQGAKKMLSIPIKYAFLIVLLFWFLGETVYAAPNFLSYFNEIGGGKWNGYHFVTDSNYDWGQDLLRLKNFVNSHPEIDKIAVDYFGGGSPQYYLGGKEVDWQSSKGNPSDQGINWLAISVNAIQGATQPVAPGFYRAPQDSYSWLTSSRPVETSRFKIGNVPEPDYRVGTSIFVYKLQ